MDQDTTSAVSIGSTLSQVTVAAIMQPTYLPWMGYFGLMDRVDKFVLLDSVQFARRSWQQRNQIKTSQGSLFLTVPVLTKGNRGQAIVDVLIDSSQGFPENHVRSIAQSYSRAPYFDRYSSGLFTILHQRHRHLVELTNNLIDWLAGELGITTQIVRSSMLAAKGTKAELLANICQEVGCHRYISPPGSSNYLDASDAFYLAGVGLAYDHFQQPIYRQCHGEFLPYMSVIDLLFNIGPDSLGVIRSGYLSKS